MNNIWLGSELKEKIRKVFELRYKKELSEEEILDIANNLISYMEHLMKFMGNKKYGTNTQNN